MDISIVQKYYHRSQDFISIIIPCYNREDYISECLDSIFSQTIPLSLYEVICVDDHSCDSTVSIIKEYEEKYPDNLLLIECEENSKGFIGKVRNLGMQYATGNYILFVDSDDKLAENALEKLYLGALISHAEIVVTGYCAFFKNQILNKTTKCEFIYDTNSVEHFKSLQRQEGTEGYIWGKLYSVGFLNQYNIRFHEDYHLAEDSLFHEMTLNYVHLYYVLSEPLYYYRYNTESSWNSSKTYQYITDCFRAQVYIYEMYSNTYKSIFYQRYGEYFDEYYAWKMAICILSINKKCQVTGNSEYFRHIWPTMKAKLYQSFPGFEKFSVVMESKEMMTLLHSD